MGKQLDYGNYTKTEYSELAEELGQRLRVLGDVTVKSDIGLSSHHMIAEITYPTQPVVIDWAIGRLDNALYMNVAGMGIWGCRNIWVRNAPKPGSLKATFYFNMSLDSDDLPLEKHSAQVLWDQVDYFIERAKVGYCYFFKNV